jgi:hypothetical protein
MSINLEQTTIRSARPSAAPIIAPVIRFRIYRLASAYRGSRIFWQKCEARVWPFLINPLTWTLIALIVSRIGLFLDLR